MVANITEIFRDFATALATCSDGYLDQELATVTARRTEELVKLLPSSDFVPDQMVGTLMALSLAFSERPTRVLRVLDFGGSCGVHFYYARRFLPFPLRWAVVETAVLCAAAARLGQDALSFHSKIEDAVRWLGEVDLTHSSGAVQCVPDPLGVITRLADIGAPHFLLARFPYWTGPRTVGVQISSMSDNALGPMPSDIPNKTVRYPVVFENLSDLQARLVNGRYGNGFFWPSPSTDYVVTGTLAQGVNFLLRAARS